MKGSFSCESSEKLLTKESYIHTQRQAHKRTHKYTDTHTVKLKYMVSIGVKRLEVYMLIMLYLNPICTSYPFFTNTN